MNEKLEIPQGGARVVQPGMLVPNLYRCNNLKCWSTKNKMRALYTLTPNASKICYCRFAAAPRVLSWPRWTGGGKSLRTPQGKFGFNVCLSSRCLSCGGHNQCRMARYRTRLKPPSTAVVWGGLGSGAQAGPDSDSS